MHQEIMEIKAKSENENEERKNPKKEQLSYSNMLFYLAIDGLVVKNPPANAGDAGHLGFNPCTGKIPWSRKRQPFPVILPGRSHRQRSLLGCTVHGVAKCWTLQSNWTHRHTAIGSIYHLSRQNDHTFCIFGDLQHMILLPWDSYWKVVKTAYFCFRIEW